ncbi:hypothetical protein HHI36_004195 [Cryptolaemus montrouzieri]|uniref:Uncharacterized protein n=1 Tax=Cryptolaemus montrouzieri TaxID=559131 RepID=A0ABD2NS33_9CUCU
MLRFLVVIILAGVLSSRKIFACNNFCSVYEDNKLSKNYSERDFRIKPKIILTNNQNLEEIPGEKIIKCLEVHEIGCKNQKFCLGCCDISANQTYHRYRTKIVSEFRCADNECCKESDFAEYKIERGCELF